jgi:glycosyltransferase involved in cell wall biosynthesis
MGPKKPTMNALSQEHILITSDFRRFKPHNEILRYFRMADASIFLTKEDIYGHVVNECLSQGTPVIASENANSARHLINEGVNGYLVSLLDESSIIDAINKPLTPNMGVAAIKTAQENTIERMSEAHLAIFEEALKQ